MVLIRLSIALVVSFITGCGIIRERQSPSNDANFELAKGAINKPLSPEETEALMGDVAGNWFYGQGLGETILAAGTVMVFPPYAIYLAGNAVLSLSGYHEVRVSEALPDSGEDVWSAVYDGVTSVPGRVTSVVAGNEYVTKTTAEKTLNRYLNKDGQAINSNETLKTWQ